MSREFVIQVFEELKALTIQADQGIPVTLLVDEEELGPTAVDLLRGGWDVYLGPDALAEDLVHLEELDGAPCLVWGPE